MQSAKCSLIGHKIYKIDRCHNVAIHTVTFQMKIHTKQNVLSKVLKESNYLVQCRGES